MEYPTPTQRARVQLVIIVLVGGVAQRVIRPKTLLGHKYRPVVFDPNFLLPKIQNFENFEYLLASNLNIWPRFASVS